MIPLTEMRVGLATPPFFNSFVRIFPLLEIIDSTSEKILEYDLVILPGGVDISPTIYGEEKSPFCGYVNPDRDTKELKVLRKIVVTKEITTPLVFGACRGIQMINAFFGGSLYQDLGEKSHGHSHQIEWIKPMISGLAELTVTNSLHHQGIKRPARNANILAIEPKTGVAEFAEFRSKNAKIYASQFHPEFFALEKAIWFFSELVRHANKLGEENETS